METADIEESLNLMKHKPLTLSDYANLYSAIHTTGRSETENYMKNDMVSTILTQYHKLKGLKSMARKVLMPCLKNSSNFAAGT